MPTYLLRDCWMGEMGGKEIVSSSERKRCQEKKKENIAYNLKSI